MYHNLQQMTNTFSISDRIHMLAHVLALRVKINVLSGDCENIRKKDNVYKTHLVNLGDADGRSEIEANGRLELTTMARRRPFAIAMWPERSRRCENQCTLGRLREHQKEG